MYLSVFITIFKSKTLARAAHQREKQGEIVDMDEDLGDNRL